MDNLFSFHKICKQNKISAVKLAAASFTVDILFCLKKICEQKYKIRGKISGRQFYREFYTFSMDYTNKILNRRQNKRPPILPQISYFYLHFI